MYSLREMQSMASTVFSAYASIAASLMLLRSVAHDMIPAPVKSFFYAVFSRFFKGIIGRYSSTHVTMVVDELKGNEIYDAAEIYLRTIVNPDAKRFNVSKTAKQKNITVSMGKDQQVTDTFQNFQLQWKLVLVVEPRRDNGEYEFGNSSSGRERRHFELTFDESKTQIVVDEYFPYIVAKANEIKEKERAIKLYMMGFPYRSDEKGGTHGGYWGCINLDHPMTFDKLAMDPVLKRCIVDDLDRFVRRRDYYKKCGKPWKRGYLLYGPPGTGKSSLIAAIANYLKFDVYELELISCSNNSQLRRIMLCTNNRSILVVEDIDCSVQLHDRQRSTKYSSKPPNSSSQLTLSGLLNFMDGLTSSCGDERIIIFTTNHKEKLDRALLRPGRMDMHIHMGYCTPEGFDILAFNYLGIEEHERLFPVIKELIREVEITPAEIAEHLMRSEDVDVALEGVIDLLKEKKDEIIEEKIEGEESYEDGSTLHSMENEKRKTMGQRD